jgi:hypothetical protein
MAKRCRCVVLVLAIVAVALVACTCEDPTPASSGSTDAPPIEPDDSGTPRSTDEGDLDPVKPGDSDSTSAEPGPDSDDTTAPASVDEDARRSELPDLVPQPRLPFDGCFKEPQDNPLSSEDLSNPVLDQVRDDILTTEQSNTKQKLPIVLVPGYLGTDTMDLAFTEMDYWYGIVDALAEQGYTQVYPAATRSTNMNGSTR